MTKNNEKIRVWKVVAFAAAVVVAITSFSYGFVGLGKKESGFHEIEVRAEDKALVYDAGLTLMYYASGSSNAIKHTLNAVKEAYSPALARAYQTLDAKKIYEDCVSLAEVNASGGQPVAVSPELFAVLADAYKKTLEKRGYNMFAGALWNEWQSLLYLEEPEAFDPLNDPDEAARLAAMAEMANDLDNFEFVIVDAEKRLVSFDVSDRYREFVVEYEITAPALDFGAMKDAYLLQLVEESLLAAGFTDGYLTAQSGLTADMETGSVSRYGVYGQENGKVGEIARIATAAPSCGWQFVAAPALENAYGYYAVADAAGTHYRHRYFDGLTGDFRENLFSCEIAGDAASAAELQYAGIVLHTLPGQAEIDAFLRETGLIACYTLIGDESSLYTVGDEAGAIAPGENTGYALRPR